MANTDLETNQLVLVCAGFDDHRPYFQTRHRRRSIVAAAFARTAKAATTAAVPAFSASRGTFDESDGLLPSGPSSADFPNGLESTWHISSCHVLDADVAAVESRPSRFAGLERDPPSAAAAATTPALDAARVFLRRDYYEPARVDGTDSGVSTHVSSSSLDGRDVAEDPQLHGGCRRSASRRTSCSSQIDAAYATRVAHERAPAHVAHARQHAFFSRASRETTESARHERLFAFVSDFGGGQFRVQTDLVVLSGSCEWCDEGLAACRIASDASTTAACTLRHRIERLEGYHPCFTGSPATKARQRNACRHSAAAAAAAVEPERFGTSADDVATKYRQLGRSAHCVFDELGRASRAGKLA